MMTRDFINLCKASMLIMVSLFLSSFWFFIYEYAKDLTFTHPFVWRNGVIKEMSYRLHIFITMLSSCVNVLTFTLAQRLAPRMRFGWLGDLWIYYYVYLGLLIADFILTYRTSDFRIWSAILFIVVQINYLVYEFFEKVRK